MDNIIWYFIRLVIHALQIYPKVQLGLPISESLRGP